MHVVDQGDISVQPEETRIQYIRPVRIRHTLRKRRHRLESEARMGGIAILSVSHHHSALPSY